MSKKNVKADETKKPEGKVIWLLRPSVQLETTAHRIQCGQAIPTPQQAKATESAAGGAQTADDGRKTLCTQLNNCRNEERKSVDGCNPPLCWRQMQLDLAGELNAILEDTFPNAKAIVVIDCLHGYTIADNKYVLRVEVFPAERTTGYPESADDGTSAHFLNPSAHIVKIGLDGHGTEANGDVRNELRREFEAAKNLGDAVGSAGGRVFMTVTCGSGEGRGSSWRPKSLKYSDAAHALRASDSVVTLERAVLDSCAGGKPSPASLQTLIAQLFTEFDEIL